MLRFCFAAVVAALSLSASAQGIADHIDQLMTAYHETGQFDGAVLVASGDEIVYEKGFGEADRSWHVPNTPETRFRIGSVTKQFTAALVLQLAEASELDLNAPITRYLPDYPAAQGRVTVHQLLSHTGGIPEHLGQPDFPDMMRDPITPLAFLDVFSGRPLDFEPGSAFRYSNSGYVLLGAIIEQVTGQTYADALRTRLLEPLGLTDTVYQTNEAVLDRMASGYDRTTTGVQHAPYIDTSIPYAAGMMVSTVHDLHQWTRALHAAAPFQNAEMLVTMTTPVLNDYAYGIGNSLIPVGSGAVRSIGHNGGIPGFTSMLMYFPETEQTIAIISNTGDSVGDIARNLAVTLHGGEATMPTRPVEAVLAEIIEADGVDAAIARYREMRVAGGAFDEDQLNTVGYQLLQAGDIPGAIRVFTLNVEMYPQASNPYDSLGEAYFNARDPENASANYLRSLELDPTNDNARAMLGRIGVAVPETQAITVPTETLDAYVGRYALAPTFVVEITRDGETLYGQPTGQPRVELAPVSETRFRVIGGDAQVSFARDGDGPASALTLHQNGRNQRGDRVD